MLETLYASFADTALAEKAAGALLDHGASEDDVSLVAHHSRYDNRSEFAAHSAAVAERATPGMYRTHAANEPAPQWTHDTQPVNAPADRGDEDLDAKSGLSTTTPGDAAAGALKGAAVGLGTGAIAAIASMTIPGVGFVAGGGALASAIAGAAGAAAAGAVAGGVYGYLKDQGVSDEAASRYEEAYNAGGAVLAVNVPSNDVDRATAESVLRKYGGANIEGYGTRK